MSLGSYSCEDVQQVRVILAESEAAGEALPAGAAGGHAADRGRDALHLHRGLPVARQNDTGATARALLVRQPAPRMLELVTLPARQLVHAHALTFVL